MMKTETTEASSVMTETILPFRTFLRVAEEENGTVPPSGTDAYGITKSSAVDRAPSHRVLPMPTDDRNDAASAFMLRTTVEARHAIRPSSITPRITHIPLVTAAPPHGAYGRIGNDRGQLVRRTS